MDTPGPLNDAVGMLINGLLVGPFMWLAAFLVLWVVDRSGLFPIRNVGRVALILVVGYIGLHVLIAGTTYTTGGSSFEPQVQGQVNEAPDAPVP